MTVQVFTGIRSFLRHIPLAIGLKHRYNFLIMHYGANVVRYEVKINLEFQLII